MLSARPLLIALLFLLTACGEAPPARQDWQHPEVTAVYPLRPGTAWVAQSSEWKDFAAGRFHDATDYIRCRAMHESGPFSTDCIENRREPGSWAVVLDIDETVLTNIEYHRMLDRKRVPFTPETWRDWVEQRSAVPVPGALAFIERVNSLGGHVVFVTNRRSYEEDATIDNLARIGLVKGRDYAFILTHTWPDGDKRKDARFIEAERRLSEGKHHSVRIIAYIGDQWTDKPSTLPHDAVFFCIPQGNLYGKPCELEGVAQ